MSEFYKEKRDWVIKNYKFLGMKEKISFVCFRFFMIFLVIAYCYYLSQVGKVEESIGVVTTTLAFLGGILLCYYISKSDGMKHRKDKLDAVDRFIEEQDINIEIVDALVRELEGYIKRKKTFATWIAGISATFLILLFTLIANWFTKIFDMYLKVAPTDELIYMLEDISWSDYMNIGSLVDAGGALLFFFIIVIMIIYFLLAILIFIEDQILVFLFDVRYVIVLGLNQENGGNGTELSDKKNRETQN